MAYAMRGNPLGQPAIEPSVLAFELSPQLSQSWTEWLRYWSAKMDAAQNMNEISGVLNAAGGDILTQGGSQELYDWAMSGVLQSMANTRAYNLQLWAPAGGYTGPATFTIADAPVDSGCTVYEPEAIANLQERYRLLVASLPALEFNAQQGYIGAQATLDAVLQDIAGLEASLQSACADVPTDIPEYVDPHAVTGPETYLIDGISITVPEGTGPTQAARMVEEGCIDSAIIKCEAGPASNATNEPPPITRAEVSLSPIGMALLAGVALLLIPGKRR